MLLTKKAVRKVCPNVSTVLVVFLILLFSTILNAQDIDIYHKNKNDNFELPYLNSKMSYDEFVLLSTNLRIKDMFYAAIVPGHAHFKAKDTKTGFLIFSIRMAAYGGLGFIYYDVKSTTNNFANTSFKEYIDEHDRYKNIYVGSLALIVSTYLFDWIHGEYRLEKKQAMIRYKYGLKLNLMRSAGMHELNQVVSFSLNF